jgi:hypothetical protein
MLLLPLFKCSIFDHNNIILIIAYKALEDYVHIVPTQERWNR